MALTDKTVANAKVGTFPDFGGLYLRAYATGKKVFVVRNRRDGKDKWITLGYYPKLSLANARLRAQAVKSGLIADAAKTFKASYDVWYKHISKEQKRAEEVNKWFIANVLPAIHSQPIISLTRSDFTLILQKIVDRGSPVMANRLFSQIKCMLEYCKDNGWVEQNVLEGVKRKNIGGKEKPRNRALTLDEIKTKLLLAPLTPTMQYPLYLMLLTGLRSSEALWVLENKSLVNIPTKDLPLTVPAIPAIRAIIKLAPPVPTDARAMAKALKRIGSDFTPHDLRRTFATRLGDLNVMPHVVEKLLGHKMQGVMAVYNHAEFWAERNAAMLLWAKTVGSIRRSIGKNK